jgi:hypothetical protein
VSDPDLDADPEFDVSHPSGHLMFRSCRGGYLHSVVLSEAVQDCDAESLAEAVLLAGEVSHLRAVMEIRRQITGAGFTPSDELAGPADLHRAETALNDHRLRADGDS